MKKTRTLNEIAWNILGEDEKGALVLSHQHGKSTWQAGEIMNKAHYKYLEIQARANHFLKMYTEYLAKTNNVKIHHTVAMFPEFKEYILMTVFERKTMKEAIRELGPGAFIVPQARTRIIGEQLKQLSEDENPFAQLLYDLILDYDRWNNVRILPFEYQEPSAFKRRNKTRLLKHFTNLMNLDPYTKKRFRETFKAKKTDRKPYYIALISNDPEEGYEVIPVKRKEDILDYVSKHLRLYLFNTSGDAEEFGYLVSKYLKDTEKNCKSGQKFWPKYRTSITLAANYLEVNNIIPRRKNLEKAFRDMDAITIKKASKKVQNIGDGQKSVREERFWDF